jgi:hypothetical protein
VDRHDALYHALYRLLPLCSVVDGRYDGRRHRLVKAVDAVRIVQDVHFRRFRYAVTRVCVCLGLDLLHGAVGGRRCGRLLALAAGFQCGAILFH